MSTNNKKEVKIGCCGFPVNRKEYFQQFKTVELQQTFYKLPQLSTVRRWREEAPEEFEFTLKAWQGITHLPSSPTYRKSGISAEELLQKQLGHFQPTPEVQEAWTRTREIAGILGAGIVVLQCPPSFKETAENYQYLKNFLRKTEREGLLLAVEFRAPWKSQTIQELASFPHFVHCVDTFKETPLTTGTYYFRLHGAPPGKKMYRYQYQDADLQFLLDVLTELPVTARKVYVMFNNISMWQDARRFQELLKEKFG